MYSSWTALAYIALPIAGGANTVTRLAAAATTTSVNEEQIKRFRFDKVSSPSVVYGACITTTAKATTKPKALLAAFKFQVSGGACG
jgi:hypothetical protein